MSGAGKRSMAELASWGIPDAPKQYERNRLCEAPESRCATKEQTGEQGRVNMYATDIQGVLLCNPCRKMCLKHDVSPKKFVNAGALPKKGPKRTGFNLPNLQECRESRGLSGREVARKAECNPSTIASIENERFTPSLDLINRIAAALGVSVSSLTEAEDEWGAA